MKLKRLNRVLQSWSQKQVGHVKTQLGLSLEILHRLEIAQDSRALTPEEDWLRCEAKRYCLVLSSLERTVARLRSRIRFLKDGDQKSCIIPIRCEETEITDIASTMACSVAEFPCTYLGLPISDKKLTKTDLLPWVERIGDKLPSWKANLMNMAGRAVWVRYVISALPIHVLIALNVPKWFIKAIN